MTLAELIKRLKEIETPETTNMEVKAIKVARLLGIQDVFVDNDEEVIIQLDKK